ncbi:MAG: ABC transporter ATP-binding protein [Bacteroidota bacterium]|nr:ABC transporter ATP-binding protein [Candidatus Kapabacteria bacterium]MCS7303011.1 ABC transporter ATP-binding protein [Candidatus Kapabacteria bacterium]MCX7937444.1 ABC transporter ATP-binding protein [Chlorobiota bacterium]MDW8075121.1 ABC transporter ATP-binding protein [Bacteroidota bacterium]MDW8271990.1 ABC transporter ATP-binding protein [Bacteroidota bacterium]
MTTVRLDNVTKRYGTVPALVSITLQIDPGELMVVVGPSGCGKSTLLRVVAGLESVSSGEIFFDGEPVTRRPPQERDVGMVFQNYALYPHMTVGENLAFPLKVRGVSREERQRRVRQVAAMLGLEALLERYPKELSGGQQQRVAVGRAVIRSPRVFLFDEPLSNLDAALRMEMRAELVALQRRLGITTIYVTHDHVEAMTMGDRIALLRDGGVVQVGSPAQLYSDPDELFVALFLSSPSLNCIEGEVVGENGSLRFVSSDVPLSYSLEPWHFRRAGVSSFEHRPYAAVLAVRPEHLRLSLTEQGDIRGTVERAEFVGHEQIAYIRSGMQRLVMRVEAGTSLRTGENVGIELSRDHLLLFDREGRRL